MKKDLLSIRDLTAKDVSLLLETARIMKAIHKEYRGALAGKSIAMIFDKPSLRTRVTFEVAMFQLGGMSIYLPGNDIALGKRETISDGARNLSRWVQGIVMRTFGHDLIEEMAKNATVPVINALTDLEHPCQALACLLTLKEHLKELKGKKVVFVGDGNNVAHSLMLVAPLVGMDFTMCCPHGYEPDETILSLTRSSAQQSGTSLKLEYDPVTAVHGADLIYTDVWVSMGKETETGTRNQAFREYQVNSDLVAHAGKQCRISHCLPAHRGEEITSEVLDGPQSIALDEAENRLHIQKAILYLLLKTK